MHAGADRQAADVSVATVPAVVYSCEQGVFDIDGSPPAKRRASRDALTWMFHLVLDSAADVELRIEEVTVTCRSAGAPLLRETYQRSYLEQMEWVTSRYELTPEYFLDHVQFGGEQPATPDIPARGVLSWVRIPFGVPRGAGADELEFRFVLTDPDGARAQLEHRVALVPRRQRLRLALPFTGAWIVIKGNDLSPITHRWTGLNGLTTFGWDFRPDPVSGADDSGPVPILAAGDGRVVHVRNDITVEWDEATREDFLRDGDLFAGNLVVIDHDNGEYTLTAHLDGGSVTVEPGEQVGRGQEIARLGRLGFVHLNVMDQPQWLAAVGVPGWFDDFERVLPNGSTQRIARGNPGTGWVVRG